MKIFSIFINVLLITYLYSIETVIFRDKIDENCDGVKRCTELKPHCVTEFNGRKSCRSCLQIFHSSKVKCIDHVNHISLERINVYVKGIFLNTDEGWKPTLKFITTENKLHIENPDAERGRMYKISGTRYNIILKFFGYILPHHPHPLQQVSLGEVLK